MQSFFLSSKLDFFRNKQIVWNNTQIFHPYENTLQNTKLNKEKKLLKYLRTSNGIIPYPQNCFSLLPTKRLSVYLLSQIIFSFFRGKCIRPFSISLEKRLTNIGNVSFYKIFPMTGNQMILLLFLCCVPGGSTEKL